VGLGDSTRLRVSQADMLFRYYTPQNLYLTERLDLRFRRVCQVNSEVHLKCILYFTELNRTKLAHINVCKINHLTQLITSINRCMYYATLFRLLLGHHQPDIRTLKVSYKIFNQIL
jgi:hypothetical protein